MKIIMGISILLCGVYCTFIAIRGLTAGKTEDLEDGFPAIKKKKNPVQFYVYIFACLAGGIAMILFGVIMLWVQIAKN